MADSHHTWEVGRNEKEMDAENWRNGLNQPGFTVDLSAQTPSLHSEKTSTLSVWSNVKVRPTLCSGWCNADMTWADSPWMIRDFECLAFFFLTGISVCCLNTVSCCCCHNVSSWVERAAHWINHFVHSSCAQLTGSDLLYSCYHMPQPHALLGMIYHSLVSLPGSDTWWHVYWKNV